MGHSRGGEGVTSAATLNTSREKPFDLKSILPLAPVDFGRMTVKGLPSMVILPYCDGDVSNQQGQHMNDDARYAFDDDVLRSNVWVMGADHNFFNTVWTPVASTRCRRATTGRAPTPRRLVPPTPSAAPPALRSTRASACHAASSTTSAPPSSRAGSV